MVKTKHQKSKPKQNPKSSHAKKHGKPADISEFRKQLDGLGLKIIQVTADGNCFFRALGDQLEGDEEQHQKYRNMVVKYIMENREIFEPFIEDEVPFDDYCQSMEKDGTWAGHMELQAASLVTRCNICIHRHDFPRWYIRNFDSREVRMIHLSYHDGEHYNSVRSKDDTCAGPARPIFIKADGDLSTTSNKAKTSNTKSREEAAGNFVETGCLKMVIDGTGCMDIEKVKKVLEEVNGDADAAIEYLIAQQGSENDIVANEVPSSEDLNHGEHQTEECKQQSAISESRTSNLERSRTKKSLPSDDKKIPRNKLCPCGSRKKYKSCCGSVAGKSSARLTINRTFEDADKKDKKQRKKASKATNHDQPAGGQQLDLGALCI
ncbi:OLC1v1010176C2 [Oldenlandia corymbosa var. corymbosa]|uniref:OLC1v1010176C2 n=1 Tax=Oldenlandia corymbosa var. corymbosa TaxID=529605 RepID=A0AAV1DQS2_OLDCO|nr:OLC1v1010176C2 [Oldenlandia corymbosa var. corymbosa]